MTPMGLFLIVVLLVLVVGAYSGLIVRWWRHSHESWDCFLSYKSENANAVRRIAERLMACGYRVWFNEYRILLPNYDEFRKEMYRGTQHCAFGLVFTTPRFFTSDDCRDEVKWLKAHFREEPLRIIEVCLESYEPEDKSRYDPQDELDLSLSHFVRAYLPEQVRDEQSEDEQLLKEIGRLTGLQLTGYFPESPTVREATFQAACAPISFDYAPFIMEERSAHPMDGTDTAKFNCPTQSIPFEFNVRFDHGLQAAPGESYNLISKSMLLKQDANTVIHSLAQQRREFASQFMSWLPMLKEDGLHLFWHQSFGQLALTHHTANLWMRKYSVILTNLPRPTEVIFTFAVVGKFTDFCRLTPMMDRIVESTRSMRSSFMSG